MKLKYEKYILEKMKYILKDDMILHTTDSSYWKSFTTGRLYANHKIYFFK